MDRQRPSTATVVAKGAIAGLAGTVVMTAFQKLVEMPITKRGDSYAPADFAERVLPVRAARGEDRKRLNYATHFALGPMWGVAYAVAKRLRLSAPLAVAGVFATVYSGDLVLNTALGLYRPWDWSGRDWAIDAVDKLVQAAATGAVYELALDR
ncbi:MAG: hypothetical protein M3472_07720 [Chloroflexota bacterium]|nr:hypothetical protein [Chloroflexota bacterium]